MLPTSHSYVRHVPFRGPCRSLLSQPTTPAPVQATAADADLLEAAKLGDLAQARDLLSAGARVNTTDRRGFTPLMWASAIGNIALVQQFIDSGAVVDARARDGTTALGLASANGFADVVRALLVRGADVTAVSGGVTARQLALERGHTDIVTMLGQAEVLGGRLLQAASEGSRHGRQAVAHDGGAGQRHRRSRGDSADDRGAQRRSRHPPGARCRKAQTRLPVTARAERSSTGPRRRRRPPSTSRHSCATEASRTRSPARACRSQSPQVKASLGALAGVMARVPPASEAVRSASQRANAALSQLVALSAKWPANSPDDYRDNLAGHVTALEAAVKAGDATRLAVNGAVRSPTTSRSSSITARRAEAPWEDRSSCA